MPVPQFLLSSLLLLLTSTPLPILASPSPPSSSTASSSSSCPSTDYANHIIRAPLPSSPTLQIKPSFLSQHLVFYYTNVSTDISEATFASFCLNQCVGYNPDPHASSTPPTGLEAFISNRNGPCLSFTVDMGKPYPPKANDTRLRWYCEAYDKTLAEDLSDYEAVNASGSYMHALGVNRDCGGSYRAF